LWMLTTTNELVHKLVLLLPGALRLPPLAAALIVTLSTVGEAEAEPITKANDGYPITTEKILVHLKEATLLRRTDGVDTLIVLKWRDQPRLFLSNALLKLKSSFDWHAHTYSKRTKLKIQTTLDDNANILVYSYNELPNLRSKLSKSKNPYIIKHFRNIYRYFDGMKSGRDNCGHVKIADGRNIVAAVWIIKISDPKLYFWRCSSLLFVKTLYFHRTPKTYESLVRSDIKYGSFYLDYLVLRLVYHDSIESGKSIKYNSKSIDAAFQSAEIKKKIRDMNYILRTNRK